MNPLFNWIFIAILVTALSSCAAKQIPQTPQQIAQGFWDAKVAQNQSKIIEYSRGADSAPPQAQMPSWQSATVTFGKMQLADKDIWIDTTIKFTEHDKPVSLNFTTVLGHDVSGWKVDHPTTMENFQVKRAELDRKENPVAELVKRLRMLGKQFAKDIDKATTELKEQMPEIKEDIKSLGKNIEKEFSEKLQQIEPAVEKNLQELSNAIDKAIEQAKKNEKPKDETPPKADPSLQQI